MEVTWDHRGRHDPNPTPAYTAREDDHRRQTGQQRAAHHISREDKPSASSAAPPSAGQPGGFFQKPSPPSPSRFEKGGSGKQPPTFRFYDPSRQNRDAPSTPRESASRGPSSSNGPNGPNGRAGGGASASPSLKNLLS